MGTLLQTFTFDRNTYRRNTETSAEQAAEHIELVRTGAALNKNASNIIGALASSVGLFVKPNGVWESSELAQVFLDLYDQNKADAWQWLIARSLWRYVVPNGTQAAVNVKANALGASFNFFDLLMRLLVLLSSLPYNARYLYFEELCLLLDDDDNWSKHPLDLFNQLIDKRQNKVGGFGSQKRWIDELEREFAIPRDNFEGLFAKPINQTGLVEFAYFDGKRVGVAIKTDLDSVLSRRLRFILDKPCEWDKSQSWPNFLALQPTDFPREVTTQIVVDQSPAEEPFPEPIIGMVEAATHAFSEAGFRVEAQLVHRFASSLLAKRFVILTGLAGSGKTKLAQCFAAWLTQPTHMTSDLFQPGTLITSTKVVYRVVASDQLSVEFLTNFDDSSSRVSVPRSLINEWMEVIEANSFTRETPPRTIRDAVQSVTPYSSYNNSFETHLKAAAFALLESKKQVSVSKMYEVVPVGADWTSNEHIVGYLDALNPTRYVRTTALDLMLRADVDSAHAYFLILDEMNLSHVERYFADFLSAIESGEEIRLHDAKDEFGNPAKPSGVPQTLKLPPNLFVIGTVNVDETTYTFSPKVLDRANVIEFRVSTAALSSFMSEPKGIDLTVLAGRGAAFARSFITESRKEVALIGQDLQTFEFEIKLFFEFLAERGGEFGFRTAKEIARFLYFCQLLQPQESAGNMDAPLHESMDFQVVQKMLPKLNGSRRKLEPILCGLASLCFEQRAVVIPTGDDAPDQSTPRTHAELLSLARSAATEGSLDNELLRRGDDGHYIYPDSSAVYPLSFEKLRRMLQRVDENGFTSFAEA